MFFVLFLIFFTLIVFWGFYILSFNFNNFVLDTNLKNFYQSTSLIKQAYKILPDVLDWYSANWSGLNDISSGFVDQNKNDDNFSCYKNFWNFEDDDCWWRSLILFIPPSAEINVGYYQLSWNFFVKCETNSSWLQILLDWSNGQIEQDFTTWLSLNLALWNWRIILKNKNLDWVQCQIYLDSLMNFDIYSGSWRVQHTYKFVNSQFKEIFTTKSINFSWYVPPTNPVWFSIISWDFNDWWSDNCQWTGNNDIVLWWYFTGDLNLSGEYMFEILSWNDLNLWNILTWLKLLDLCSLNDSWNWQCRWTWYDYVTWDYYFKINAVRCINGDCGNILKNIWWSEIEKVHIDYCK
jgi:hypothetical protein